MLLLSAVQSLAFPGPWPSLMSAFGSPCLSFSLFCRVSCCVPFTNAERNSKPTQSLFSHNGALSGGALAIGQACNATLSGCSLWGNQAEEGGLPFFSHSPFFPLLHSCPFFLLSVLQIEPTHATNRLRLGAIHVNVSADALPLSLSPPATAVFNNVVSGYLQGARGSLAGGGIFFSGNVLDLQIRETDIHRSVLADLNAYSNVAYWGENIASCEFSFRRSASHAR